VASQRSRGRFGPTHGEFGYVSKRSTNDGHRPRELVAVGQLVSRLSVLVASSVGVEVGDELDDVRGTEILVGGRVPRS